MPDKCVAILTVIPQYWRMKTIGSNELFLVVPVSVDRYILLSPFCPFTMVQSKTHSQEHILLSKTPIHGGSDHTPVIVIKGKRLWRLPPVSPLHCLIPHSFLIPSKPTHNPSVHSSTSHSSNYKTVSWWNRTDNLQFPTAIIPSLSPQPESTHTDNLLPFQNQLNFTLLWILFFQFWLLKLYLPKSLHFLPPGHLLADSPAFLARPLPPSQPSPPHR